ncbi:hypothetical protein Pve01_84260 [Planomonospora venezuelensis]|nr:hypothetical protein Pve01_84260 [Planomonospora venezuelensis]
MRICLIASSRFPIREPFAGGLESMTWTTARGLAERGHDVTLFAGPGSDTSLPVRLLPLSTVEVSSAAMADKFAPGPGWLAEHHAYLSLMLSLARTGAEEYDVVHNNSLHHLPIAMAPAVDVPMLTTLHTPPLPMIESAVALCSRPPRFVAVSEWTATSWRHAVESDVVLNGLDLRDWPAGPGGGPAVWSGRIVPEKAPHLAVEACRLAGVPLVLAGPVQDQAYFDRAVAPLLGVDAMYAGHLAQRKLSQLLRQASVAVVTPMWDEPYGLVAAEAIRAGLFDDLAPSELAAVLSALVFEARRADDASSPKMPGGQVRPVLAELVRLWGQLDALERDHRLDFLREPDMGFAWAAWRWAEGDDLDDVLMVTGLSAGDFVRWMKQLLDLCGQVADAAGERDLRDTARATARLLKRGVIAYSVLAE